MITSAKFKSYVVTLCQRIISLLAVTHFRLSINMLLIFTNNSFIYDRENVFQFMYVILYLNSSFNNQMPFPDNESLVKVQICLSIERNTTESLCGSLEPNSSKISCVVACPIVVHCDAMKFRIWTSKSSPLFPGASPESLLSSKLFRALILASS